MNPSPFKPVTSPPDTHTVTSKIDADSRPTGSRRRRWSPKGLIVGLIVIVACVFVMGSFLRRQSESAVDVTGATGEESIDSGQGHPDFAAQVANVVAGDSTRLLFADVPISDGMLQDLPVQLLTGLDTVVADQGVVTDEGLTALAKLPGLEQLRLRHSPITDAGVAALVGCEKLWLLNLPQCQVSSKGIESLKKVTALTQLRLGSPRLGNEACTAIAELKSLRGLHLIGVPVTDEGLQTLASLPHLDSLYLDDCEVTEAGWDWLFQHHPQLHVHVDQAHHDRDPNLHSH
ncbi:Leucine Rich repeats (2 copies) [Allorhodopirellula heiligendammensis]|uniref:Leucine Rich repeats (2 copies) n=1 Tax=Allorhodopirellula heiligendammensis TaxID=2714739 RepID=A0A5C6BEE4_9BACT|nr:Leucine Rich repeats (2 copies) [Allorhodopirellula heiligendammensis]